MSTVADLADPPVLAPDVLRGIVRHALGRETAELSGWSTQRLGGGASAALVYRVRGSAQDAHRHLPWSLILKVVPSPDAREGRLLESGWSATLEQRSGGLLAPRCYGVDRPDASASSGSTWLWLEDVADAYDGHWPIARYGLAARHLGQFNGDFIGPVPGTGFPGAFADPGWLRAKVAQAAASVARLPTYVDHPELGRLYTPALVASVQGLWRERRALLDALDRLPHTACHRDPHRRNLFAVRQPGGVERTVAIDWSMAGVGALGEDLAGFVASSLIFAANDTPPPERWAELETAAFASYLDGLHDAGWRGEAPLVRFGYAATVALRHGLAAAGDAAEYGLDDERRAYLEAVLGRPFAELLDVGDRLMRFFLARADEARAFLRSRSL